MATSFISIDGRGVWCPDSLIEIFALLLAEQLRRQPSEPLLAYAEHLVTQATTIALGCIDLGLATLDTNSKQQVARAAADVAALGLEQPARLSVTELSRVGLVGFERDVDGELVVALAEVVVALLRDEWRWSAADEQSLPRHWLHRKR